MKKLEKEELLKVIGILAEAEGYDLLTMNKYGSNPSSIAVLYGETGVEYAPVDMDLCCIRIWPVNRYPWL